MIPESVAAKIIGTFSGTFLALVFLPPRTMSGFLRRGSASVVFGLSMGNVSHGYLQGFVALNDTFEHVIAAYCITAYASWWVMGGLTKAAEKLSRKD